MGSPLTPGPNPDVQAAQVAGRKALSQALSGEPAPAVPTAPPAAPPPEPAAPEPQPVAAPVAPPAPSPQSPPVPPAEPVTEPVPAAETLLDPATLTDDARRSLEMEGWKEGDPITPELFNKILERKQEFNNRLGHREVPLPEETPAPPEELAPEPAPVDPNVIAEQVRAQIVQDPEALEWVKTWKANDTQLQTLGIGQNGRPTGEGQLAEKEKALNMAKLRLEIPEIRDDSTGIAAAEIKEEIRSLGSDIRDLKADARFLLAENGDLAQRYEQREEQYGYQVREGLEEQHQEALSKERVARHTEEISRDWPNALKRVADKHGYTPEDMQELNDRAKDAGFAQISQGLGAIEDIEAFLEAQAVRLDQTMDRYHRRQSGIYAQQVTGRTQPVQPPAAPAPAPAQAQADDSLDSLYRRTRATLAENRRA